MLVMARRSSRISSSYESEPSPREEEENFMEDLALMGIPPAHVYPRATDHIPEMIEMIHDDETGSTT